MSKFWFRLSVAFVDLVLAGIMAGRGHTGWAMLLFALACLLGGFALFSTPPAPRPVRRDSRGRPMQREFPYESLLGTLGAIAILGTAAYVAHATTRPPDPDARPARPAAVATAAASAWTPPPSALRSSRPIGSSHHLLHKCIDPAGAVSIQSQSCPEGHETAWIRDATPAYESSGRRAASSRSSSGSGAWHTPPSTTVRGHDTTCAAARAAEAAYRRLPLASQTYDGLEMHADAVREACY